VSYILLTWLLAPIWWPLAIARRFINGTPSRIVIFEIAGIGDVVCSTHLFAQLRARYPDAIIDLVVDPIAVSLAPALPMINRVIQFPYERQRGFMGRLRLTKCCLGYDTAICLIPSAAQLIGFCLAAVPRRLAVLPAPLNNSYRSLRPLLTDVALHHTGQYFLQTQATLLQAVDVAKADARKWMPVSETQFNSKVPCLNETINIGLLISSGRALKRIEPDKLAAIVAQLLDSATIAPVKTVLIGGPADKALAQSIVERLTEAQRTQIEDAVGRYALNELPHLLTQLSVLIGVDSGVTHMADALGVPVVCVAGPVDLNEVYQAGEMRQRITADLPCYPCSTVFDTPSQCRTGDLACLRQLNTDSVVHVARSLLEKTGKQ
jgi:heptosyltransferase II